MDIVNMNNYANGLNVKTAAGFSAILSVTGAGNTNIAGTLGVSGNTTLNGSLTQSVGGTTKFSVDT